MTTKSVEVLEYDFEIPNNGDYLKTWALTDKTSGVSIVDDVNVTMRLDLKDSLDITATPVLTLVNAALVAPRVTGIVYSAAILTTGEFDVCIRRSELESRIVAPAKKRIFYYDLVLTWPDTITIKYAQGKITLNMGVTDID